MASDAAKPAPASAGILLFRRASGGIEVLLAHPGGPFFARKDEGAWTIPKGLIEAEEPPQDAALREFEEEVGWRPAGELIEIGEARLKSGKRVIAFAVHSADDPATLHDRFSPGAFTMEWPRGSGRYAEFPEIDRIEFFPLEVARRRINPAQQPLLDRLAKLND